MTLFMIGIGLGDEKDISIKGIETIKKCDKVYLESYTSKLACSIDAMEKLYEKKIIIADRELVEKNAETTILSDAKYGNCAFLVIGDIFSATTHTDLLLRAKHTGINVVFIHNASILTAIGETGLELYKFGKITSIPFYNKNIKTPIEVYKKNHTQGMHTLLLLDLDPIQNKFMTINDAATYLIANEISPQTMAAGCAGLGTDKSKICYATLEQLKDLIFTIYPQCLIIPSNMHFMEEDTIMLYKAQD